MEKWISPHIQKMQAYVSGEQSQDASVIKLNSNECPYDPPQAVVDALVAVSGEQLRKYPSARGDSLRQKLADVYGLHQENILIGNGSDEILTMLMRACVEPGEAVAFPEPTYVLYRTLADIQKGQVLTIPFDANYQISVDQVALLKAKIFFLANPNSPSGTRIDKQNVKALAQAFDGLFVVDEAYVDFADDHCLSLVGECDNVIVLRSMSKSVALAGARLGWAYGPQSTIAQLMKVKDSYNVNALTQAVALAVLEAKPEIDRMIDKIKATRESLVEKLTAMGWDVCPSEANFVWIKPSCKPAEIYTRLKQEGILIRYFDDLADYVRITVGTDEEMKVLIKKLENFA